MSEITAKIEYRGYVPYGWIALTFCHVRFYGENSHYYENLWHELEYDKLHKYRELISQISAKIEKDTETMKTHNWFKRTFSDTSLKSSINTNRAKLKEYENDSFYDATELFVRADRFLKDNTFVLLSTSNSGGECGEEIYIYRKLTPTPRPGAEDN